MKEQSQHPRRSRANHELRF